jgi:kynureninase
VLGWMAARGITVEHVHAHATALMEHFLARLQPLGLPGVTRADLITPFGDGVAHGNFLSFRTRHADAIEAALGRVDVQADHRGDRMRFGFGLSITRAEVDAAIARITTALGGF